MNAGISWGNAGRMNGFTRLTVKLLHHVPFCRSRSGKHACLQRKAPIVKHKWPRGTSIIFAGGTADMKRKAATFSMRMISEPASQRRCRAWYIIYKLKAQSSKLKA
jgi:hypothetical protein